MWRPIDTAPADGRLVLAWNDDVYLIVCRVGDCWYNDGKPYTGKYALARPLTHWMPLPKAPDVITDGAVDAAADAIRAELRTFRVEWFVEDANSPEEDGHDLTPYNCLAVAALSAAFRAAGIELPEVILSEWRKDDRKQRITTDRVATD